MSERANQIITDALNTSPYARCIHDKLYKTGFYKYQSRPQVGSEKAAVSWMVSSLDEVAGINLIFDASGSHVGGVSGVHHELVHINQIRNDQIFALASYNFTQSLGSSIVWNLIKEIQAFTLQYEGPVCAFQRDLEKKDYKRTELYSNLFSMETDVTDAKSAYLRALFKESADGFARTGRIDSGVILKFEDFEKLSPEEKKKRFLEARKAFANAFLYRPDGKLSNIADSYISDNIDRNTPKVKKEKVYKDPLLDDLLETTLMCDGQEFLTKEDWYEVLKGRSNAAVASAIISRSRNLTKYTYALSGN